MFAVKFVLAVICICFWLNHKVGGPESSQKVKSVDKTQYFFSYIGCFQFRQTWFLKEQELMTATPQPDHHHTKITSAEHNSSTWVWNVLALLLCRWEEWWCSIHFYPLVSSDCHWFPANKPDIVVSKTGRSGSDHHPRLYPHPPPWSPGLILSVCQWAQDPQLEHGTHSIRWGSGFH